MSLSSLLQPCDSTSLSETTRKCPGTTPRQVLSVTYDCDFDHNDLPQSSCIQVVFAPVATGRVRIATKWVVVTDGQIA
jgi:hypothetical protein